MNPGNRIAVVNLNLNIERVWRVSRLIPGTVHRVARPLAQAGGKGVNAARVLMTLGRDPVVIGAAGGFSGRWIAGDLKQRGIRARLFRVSGESRTCATVNDEAAGADTVFNEPGCALTKAEAAGLERFTVSSLSGACGALFAGSVPPGVTPASYGRMVKAAVREGLPAIVDITGPCLLEAAQQGPLAVKPNIRELGGLFGKTLRSAADVRRAADKLLDKGARWVIVSAGASGAEFYRRGKRMKIMPPKVRSVNTIGCGDALGAAFLHGILSGWDEERVARFAVAVAAAHALTPLPGDVRIRDIARLFGETAVHEFMSSRVHENGRGRGQGSGTP